MAPPENTRLYIGNLPYDATNDELRAHITNLGMSPRDVHVVMDKETGGGRGFGFVEFASGDDAGQAVGLLQGSFLGGRTLSASPANPRPVRTGRDQGPPPDRSAKRDRR